MSSLYYANRAEAGKALAKELASYANKSTAVVAISQGSVIIGAQIAMALHTNLLIHLIQNIYLPGEHEAIASIGSEGTFMYNQAFSPGEVEEYASEFRTYIDQKRFESMHDLHILLGSDGEIDKSLLRHHVVILVSDGLDSALSVDLVGAFFRTIAIKKLVVATPLASTKAVDRMRLMTDEVHCTNVVANFLDVNHYYEDNTLPGIDDALKIMRNIALSWQRPKTK